MSHLDPPAAPEPDHPSVAARNAYLGLILFAVYGTLYAVFIVLNAFASDVMGAIVLVGVNLAVVYGLGLIVAAFVIALVYAWLCRTGARP